MHWVHVIYPRGDRQLLLTPRSLLWDFRVHNMDHGAKRLPNLSYLVSYPPIPLVNIYKAQLQLVMERLFLP